MVCPDYLISGLWCLKGIPVTRGFSRFFCESAPERCPFVIRGDEISRIISFRRSKTFKNLGGFHEMSLSRKMGCVCL